jgi:hypothetical protein
MRRVKIASIAGAIISLLVFLFVTDKLSWAAPNSSLPAKVPTSSPSVIATMTPSPSATPAQSLALSVMPHVLPTPTAAPTKAGATPVATLNPALPTPTPKPATASGGDRYFPAGTSVDAIKSGSKSISRQQVKLLIEGQVDKNWSVIQDRTGFTTKEKAYAFFLGFSTREATLQVVLETGDGPSHSYGPLQTAEPAYVNDKNYAPEKDVPEMTQYDLTDQNFYDPGIAVHSGIRHFLHFATQAKKAGYTGKELLRHALIGFNSGSIESDDPQWMKEYADEIGALSGWYLQGHLTDAAYTYTGSTSGVDRNNPWGWY